MKEKTIRNLCQKKGFGKCELFVKFFMARFPKEEDDIHSYCEEWIDRFMTSNPIVYMDEKSKDVYLNLVNEG